MESAIRHFERAIALNPEDADSRYWIGGIKQAMGDIDAAEAAYAVATQIRPLVRPGLDIETKGETLRVTGGHPLGL